MNELVLSGRTEWAESITAAWRTTLDGVLETGRRLIASKKQLGHGEFLPMIEKDLPFKKSTAEALMAIAKDPRLSNSQHVGILPPSWGTLYEMTKLDHGQWAEAEEAGLIRPDVERKEIRAFVNPRKPPKLQPKCGSYSSGKEIFGRLAAVQRELKEIGQLRKPSMAIIASVREQLSNVNDELHQTSKRLTGGVQCLSI